MKSVFFLSTFSTLATALLSSSAFAGPLVSSGGFAMLAASCEAPNLDISVVSYDGVLKANVSVQGPARTNLLSTVVTVKTPVQINALEFASAQGSHPAFDLVIASTKSSDGSFEAFLSAELNNSNVVVSQPVKCFYARAPLK